MFLFSPFEQFQVQYFFKSDSFYFTDTLLVSLFILFFFQLLYLLIHFKDSVYHVNMVNYVFQNIYSFVYESVYEYLSNDGRKYFPFLFYLFVFISISNLIGILPYSFTITSHLSITFSLAFVAWYGMAVGVGFNKYGINIFSMFFPKTIPFRLVPLLVFIETISFVFKSVSLALRLFANIVAGHILLDTIALVVHKMLFPSYFVTTKSILISILPLIITIVLILFEMAVAVLQGYIFMILCCIYLKDMVDLH
jgi:ATP synthase subunit 6